MCQHNFDLFSWSGHEEALSRFTLKKLLLLVCFLDKAKESRLIEHNPCLFCLDAEFKVRPRPSHVARIIKSPQTNLYGYLVLLLIHFFSEVFKFYILRCKYAKLPPSTS